MPQRLKCLTKKQLLAQYSTELSNLVPIEDAEEPAKIQAHIRKKTEQHKHQYTTANSENEKN